MTAKPPSDPPSPFPALSTGSLATDLLHDGSPWRPWRFDSLPDYPFPRLRALLNGIEPGRPPIDLAIGEPKHPFPPLVQEILSRSMEGYGRYPPNQGTPAFRQACHRWLNRRYGLDPDFLDPDRQILPLNGTREGLFMAAQIVAGHKQSPGAGSSGQGPSQPCRPAILMPDPFYQCYAGAAVGVGAEPVMVPTCPETDHLPDLGTIDPALLARTIAFYVCSPANPQGTVASLEYWCRLIRLAEQHDFLILADECYAEIYDQDPPPGILEAAFQKNLQIERILGFHSLSKRSNVPGLRSGFVAGGKTPMDRLMRVRSYGGAPSPFPVLEAAAALWDEDNHAAENRQRYRAKVDLAADCLGDRFGFYRPPGGFFLWLDMAQTGMTGEEAALHLWRSQGVRVLPGAYLSALAPTGAQAGTLAGPQANAGPGTVGGAKEGTVGVGAETGSDENLAAGSDQKDQNAGLATRYVRLALVHDESVTEDALRRLVAAF